MDLGCMDLGCIEKRSNEVFLDSGTNLNDPVMATSKVGKNKALKESGLSNVSSLNKFTSQIKKPSHRKSSPLNWFPRKKVDSYLKRKIQRLQEVGGMNSTLDETLGDSNPHYSRVLREKIAVREAAHKAMEARKAAMVEASWCRILQAARRTGVIQSKEAEAQLLETEKSAAEAFEAATAVGVIMYDMQDCPRKHYEIETFSLNGGGSTTHTVTASFETAFEVDKQVAAAVKTSFVKLASCPSINKDEFKELLRKISENPDTGENYQDPSELSSEYESDNGSEHESQDVRQRKYKKQISEKFNMPKLVDMMLERLRCLQEGELASLATIVATCGLNAALAEAENSKQLDLGYAADSNSGIDHMRKKQVEAELPSLDKFLVKHLKKLEKEVQEVKNARMNTLDKSSDDEKVCSINDVSSAETIPDLGTILVKHSSKLEKEIEEMKRKSGKSDEMESKKISERRRSGVVRRTKQDATDLPSLDKFLVRHVSKLEREVQEAKNRRKFEPSEGGRTADLRKKATSVNQAHTLEEGTNSSCSDRDRLVGKENIDLNKGDGGELEMEQKEASKPENTEDCSEETLIQIRQTNPDAAEMKETTEDCSLSSLQHGNGESKEKEDSLDKILVKPVHRLEREKMQALSLGSEYGIKRYQKKQPGGASVGDYESLDKVLVKHVSRLEKEKMVMGMKEEAGRVKRRDPNAPSEMSEGSLDQILVKHKSRLEREKMAAAAQQPDHQVKHSVTRREARERELQEAWGGLSLGNSVLPHISRLERDKLLGSKLKKRKGGEIWRRCEVFKPKSLLGYVLSDVQIATKAKSVDQLFFGRKTSFLMLEIVCDDQ
ncbi:unnamed protein product [Camellia sinensis]